MKKISYLFVFLILLLCLFQVSAEETDTIIEGKFYEFNEDSEYEIAKTKENISTSEVETYGKFFLRGNVKNTGEKNGIPAYEVVDGVLSMGYKYDAAILNANIDCWHLCSDETDIFDGREFDDDIQKGLLWLQTSMDGNNWNTAICLTDAFNTIPINDDAHYIAKEIELINGCYYKLSVAYETCIRTEESDFLFIDTDEFDYKKNAEVYEFFAFTKTEETDQIDFSQTYNIGTKIRVKDYDGYIGEERIEKNDIHYGWDLGNFFISGYTDKRVNDESVVFLKNPGDKVTLWFNLKQNLTALNNNTDLRIVSDEEGYDHYFETPRMDFGKGVLIIRYTDHNNNKAEPQIFTDYLKANTYFGANTKVQLFEEGDYEVALNYKIDEDRLFGDEGYYRIFFKFSVRNGNCMVYPFDVVTGGELNNTAITENGFRLDLARSRYLKVFVKREILTDGADGLVEDTRFNSPAKDGAQYIDEGIYTITVSNDHTNQTTEKKIYVGTNNIMRAHVTTGLSIPEINELVADGAKISDDGMIEGVNLASVSASDKESSQENHSLLILIIIGATVIITAIVVFFLIKKSKKRSGEE